MNRKRSLKQAFKEEGRPAEEIGRIFRGITEPTTTTRLYSHLRSRARAGRNSKSKKTEKLQDRITIQQKF